MNYIMNGYYHVQSKRTFVTHIGYKQSQTKFWKDQYVGSDGFNKLTGQWAVFDEWMK